MESGLNLDIAEQTYHAHPAVSKSQLDLVRRSPALLAWDRAAPIDEHAFAAVDLGTAIERLLMEGAERFEQHYALAPEVDKRTREGKAEHAEFLASAGQRTVIDAESMRALRLMRDSALAHPDVAKFLAAEAHQQASMLWGDAASGLECRCRPDWMLTQAPVVADIKTVAGLDRFERAAAEFRYHVQDAFYTDGMREYYGERPYFLFVVVSSTRAKARYPVAVYELTPQDRERGREEYRADLAAYQRHLDNPAALHFEPLELPRWYRNLHDSDQEHQR